MMKSKKRIRIIILIGSFFFSIQSLFPQSPQVLRVSQIKDVSGVSETLQRNGNHFYTGVGKYSNEDRDITDDLEIDSFTFLSIINPSSGFPIGNYSSVILDYEIGEGFVDYDYMSNNFSHEGCYKNDSLVAFGYVANHCTWNGNTYSPEVIPDTAVAGRYIGVINYQRDSLMFLTKTSVESRLEVDMLTLDGDHLYVVTRTNEDTFEFMGEFFPEVIDPNWNVKHLHKINWKMGVKEWSRQFSTDIDQDYLFDIKVVEDGSLIIAKRITGRTHWDGVPIEGNSVYDGGYAFFRISPEGDLVDYIQSACDCKGFHKIHIEDDGALMLYGAQRYIPNLTLGDLTFELNSDTLFGLFGFVPSDWQNPWIKTYHGEFSTSVIGGTYSFEQNEIIPFIKFQESTDVEGFYFETADKGIFDNPNDGRSENIFVAYNMDGTVSKNPISIPLNARIYEIHEVNKNHYLFYVEEKFGATSTLFDTKLDDFQKANFMIFEIEGDLFDIVDHLEELISPYMNGMDVYPNPALSESEVHIRGSKEMKAIEAVYLISASGGTMAIADFTADDEGIHLILPAAAPGLYTLQVRQKGQLQQTKMVIK